MKLNQNSICLEVENVSKTYRMYGKPINIVKQKFYDKFGLSKECYVKHEALKNINLTLHRGETVGLVGKNGSGKSTLLQIIAGTLKPDCGLIVKKGRIAALLELGSGFNPEFTGIENIFFNAQIIGLRQKEIKESLDSIVKFADIGDYINKPVKTYSSGMVLRLAFAVQAHTKPEIMIVDEALAVGDELFQKKCYSHISKLKKEHSYS